MVPAAPAVPVFAAIPPAPHRIVLTPDALSAPSCASADACFILGSRGPAGGPPVLGLYDGAQLRIVGRAPSGVTLLSCPTARFCVAVGPGPETTRSPESWSWSSGRWRRLALPALPTHQPGGSTRISWFFSDVTCSSTRNCVAVGGSQPTGDTSFPPSVPLILGFSGGRWSRERPAARLGTLTSVSCGSASACVTVGDADYDLTGRLAVPEVLRDGRWSADAPTVLPGTHANEYSAVSCSSAVRCVAVGSADGRAVPNGLSSREGALAEWNGSAWTTAALPPVPHEVPSRVGEALYDVSCPPGRATTCVADGTRGGATPGDGSGMVSEIPASGTPVSRSRPLADRGTDSLDCPTESLCLLNGPYDTFRSSFSSP